MTSPADLRVTYLPSNNSISVLYSLLNVTEEFGEILGYKIILYTADSPYNSTVYTQGPNETSRTVPLIAGQYYYYIRVLAFTLAGDGPVSEVYFSQPGYTTGTMSQWRNQPWRDRWRKHLPSTLNRQNLSPNLVTMSQYHLKYSAMPRRTGGTLVTGTVPGATLER